MLMIAPALAGIGQALCSLNKKLDQLRRLYKGRYYAMVVNLRKCVGCHVCTIVCKAEFNVPLGVWRTWVKIRESGIYPGVRRSFLPKLCNNCRKAPCVDVCPTHRVRKRLVPSCVDACVSGARTFGDFNDLDSNVSKLIKANKGSVLKPELGTKPLVYYIGDVDE